MKVLVTSIGTRGDMEPFLAIGEILAKKGHEVVCMFPEQFRSLAEESGFGFVSLGTEFMEINTSSGGLVKPGSFDEELFHFVSMIPYEWIFPKVYGVIHHGGSGTTHATLKNGCASMIIPHIIDQFVWNDMVFEKGAGPRGIRIGDITEKNLEPKILSLVNNPAYKKKAENIAAQMKSEDLTEALYEEIIR